MKGIRVDTAKRVARVEGDCTWGVSITRPTPSGSPPPGWGALHNRRCRLTRYTGPMDKAEEAVKPIGECATPVLDLMGPLPYPALNSLFDALLPPGLRHYWKAD